MSLSGNCHKVKLILEYTGQKYQWHEIDTRKKETFTPEFIAMNANGKVPTVQLEDGTFLAESNAILYYFSQGTSFWPKYKKEQAQVLQWMFFEQYDHEPTIAVNRSILTIKKTMDQRRATYEENLIKGNKVLTVMENHLKSRDFFVGGTCSIADIALYAYTYVADQGGFDLNLYPAIQKWLKNVEKTSGHSRMITL